MYGFTPTEEQKMWIDAVARTTSSPGADCRSGFVKRPAETCAIQLADGATETRPEYEFIGPQSIFQRFSFGSVP